MKRFGVGVALAALAFGCSASWGQPPPRFALATQREAVLLGTGVALGATALGLASKVEPLSSAQIAALDPGDVNSFDRDAIAPYRDERAGDALLAVSYAIPLGLLAAAEPRREWKTLGVTWAEAVLLQLGMNGVVKAAVQRTRPYVYDAATPLERKTDTAARLSFYSGHTSQVAVNSFFAARVFSVYTTSTRRKVLAWSGAALLPAAAGYLRQDSAHHFPTDVITGYCVGALVGALMPELHRVRGLQHVHATPIDGGIGFAVRHAWGGPARAYAELGQPACNLRHP